MQQVTKAMVHVDQVKLQFFVLVGLAWVNTTDPMSAMLSKRSPLRTTVTDAAMNAALSGSG